MKKFWTVSLVFAVGLLAAASYFPLKTAGQRDKFKSSSRGITNRYIVVLEEKIVGSSLAPQAVEAEAEYLTYAYGGKPDRVYSNVLKGFAAEMSPEQARALSEDERVKFVEPDMEIFPAGSQSNAGWHLDRVDQRSYPLNGKYDYAETGAGVHVYVVDSGIRVSHADFGGRASVGFDAVGDGQNGLDCTGHGTHVAGIIGGATYGVAKDAYLHSVRVLPCSGGGQVSWLIAGVDWITANRQGPAVVNISITASGISSAMENAITNSINSGITYAVAAGNGGLDACNYSPARTAKAITVGAAGEADDRTNYSNYGACLDIFAPGNAILSANHTGDTAVRYMSGTSQASPMVAGAAALYLSANPGASPAAVEQAIKSSSTSGIMSNLGAGSPNLLLYSWVAGGSTPTPTPNPTPTPTPTPAPTPTPSPTPKPGTITIKKRTKNNNGGGAQSFTAFPYYAVNLAASNFVLVDTQEYIDPTVTAYGWQNTVSVTEQPVTGWKLVEVTCEETSGGPPNFQNSSIDLANKKANIVVEEGENVTCTFVSEPLAPSAAKAFLSGRVANSIGLGVRGVTLSLHNGRTGETRFAISNSFGYYRFDDLDVQEVYVISASARRRSIANNTKTFTLSGDLTGMDFTVGSGSF